MELDLSVPSSGASTAQQTPDSSQTPLIVSNEQQGLETKPASAEESEKDKAETSGEESKEKEQRAGLLNSDLDDKGVASELHKKEEVLKESSVDVGTLAEQETVLYVEKSSVEKTKKSDTRDIGKSSTEGNAQEEAKLSEGDKDTEMAVEQKAASGEKSEVDAEPEKMEIDAVSTDTSGDVKVGETAIIGSPAPPNNFTTSSADSGAMPAQSLPAVETKRPPLTAEQQAKKKELMDLCIRALEYCLRRFPQHHKSRYRLAYVYYYSSEHKETSACRDLLLGSNTRQIKTFPFHHFGLFNEKSKTNLFSAFWRIPEEDIDRPGCFCTHTYKSVALLLDVLSELKEWDTLLVIQNLLHSTPAPGKKFLRDNERHHLAKKAFEYSLEIMKVRVSDQDPKVRTVRTLRTVRRTKNEER